MSYEQSKSIVGRLLRKEFDNLDNEIATYEEARELIQVAKDFGLDDLADEMQNDL